MGRHLLYDHVPRSKITGCTIRETITKTSRQKAVKNNKQIEGSRFSIHARLIITIIIIVFCVFLEYFFVTMPYVLYCMLDSHLSHRPCRVYLLTHVILASVPSIHPSVLLFLFMTWYSLDFHSAVRLADGVALASLSLSLCTHMPFMLFYSTTALPF